MSRVVIWLKDPCPCCYNTYNNNIKNSNGKTQVIATLRLVSFGHFHNIVTYYVVCIFPTSFALIKNLNLFNHNNWLYLDDTSFHYLVKSLAKFLFYCTWSLKLLIVVIICISYFRMYDREFNVYLVRCYLFYTILISLLISFTGVN